MPLLARLTAHPGSSPSGLTNHVAAMDLAGPGSLAVVYQNRAQNCSYHAQ